MEIGVDCVEIKRFEDISNKEKLLKKLFTKNEVNYAKKRKPSSQHFAARFAAKEAIIKALSIYNIKVPHNKIEVVNKKDGSPCCIIHDNKLKDLEIKISLSHSKTIAIAFVMIDEINK